MLQRTAHGNAAHNGMFTSHESWRLGVDFDAACLSTEAPHVLVSLTSPRRLDGKGDLTPCFAITSTAVTAPSPAVLRSLCRADHGRRLLQHLHEAAERLGVKLGSSSDCDSSAASRHLDEDLCSAHAAILELDEEIVSNSSGAKESDGHEAVRDVQRWLQQVQAFVMAAQKDLASSYGEECDGSSSMMDAMHRWRRQSHWARFVTLALPKLILLRSGTQAALEELHCQELQKAQAEQQQLASRASAMASVQRRIVSRLARMPYYSHWAKGVAM